MANRDLAHKAMAMVDALAEKKGKKPCGKKKCDCGCADLEEAKKRGKGVEATLASIGRWLKGATPTVTHYDKKMKEFAGNAPRDPDKAAAFQQASGAVHDLFDAIRRLQAALKDLE